MSATDHLPHLKLINNGFLFNMHSGQFWRVSETAAFLFNELKWRNVSIDTLTQAYALSYDVPKGTAERDVELFLNDMSAHLTIR